MAIWHAGNTISNIISGFLAAGILMNMENTLGLHSWQWMFIIEGGASILVALSGFLLLPDWPHNTKWLSEQEKEMAQYRMRLSNGDQDESQGGTWAGVKDAVRDPFTWYFCGMHFALITAQSFKDFLPSVRLSDVTHLCISTDCKSDHRNVRIRHSQDIPGASAALCHCIRCCVSASLDVRSHARVLLAHCNSHRS